MHACLRGKERLVQLLIDNGADIVAMDVVSHKHHTPTNTCTLCFCLSLTQKGESCLNFTETLRNRVILESILKECRKQGISVDVESLVN